MNTYKKITKQQADSRNITQLTSEQRNSVRTILNSFKTYFINKHT